MWTQRRASVMSVLWWSKKNEINFNYNIPLEIYEADMEKRLSKFSCEKFTLKNEFHQMINSPGKHIAFGSPT